MIEVKNLSKFYGQHTAVDNISFNVNKGEILGFLGPNGAGKTTTMNIITGYISASEGSVSIDGYDILSDPIEAKKKIGYLPELPPLYFDMTVNEYLAFAADLKNVRNNKRKEIEWAMEQVKINDHQNRLIKNLSKGYKQRVGLAQALLGSPELLILDEPTVGLDPRQIIEIRSLVKELGREHTIVLSSHVLPEVSAICERVLIINKGKIVASDSPENLSKNLAGSSKLIARVMGPEDKVIKVLRAIPGVKEAHMQTVREPNTVDVIITGSEQFDIRASIFKALSKADMPMLMMKSMDMTLEQIFVQVTSTGGKN